MVNGFAVKQRSMACLPSTGGGDIFAQLALRQQRLKLNDPPIAAIILDPSADEATNLRKEAPQIPVTRRRVKILNHHGAAGVVAIRPARPARPEASGRQPRLINHALMSRVPCWRKPEEVMSPRTLGVRAAMLGWVTTWSSFTTAVASNGSHRAQLSLSGSETPPSASLMSERLQARERDREASTRGICPHYEIHLSP
eukprot:CAMPEP_0204583638 /NCGR_PEP_ID=MMETSP0661-20131031/45888_1 /ASSEMBLY_ACC=CAM_ASM_000606 /TAXON_ID=109239 /ORGANISM="Alexandrium margalefi, Strain AMGDE01CS-322" /LENGTH=197 /DNA_ID=CAMNT_0051593013 /DNA_START=189 /DNA_END=780 /DNA_ORIENTATION=+